MKQKDGAIYIWTNLINRKQYVGQTTRTLNQRMSEHKNSAGCPIIHAAIKKHGIEKFKIISFSCPEEDLDWTEGFLQKTLNTISPNGYNLILNEHQHRRHNEISIQKMRDNHWDNSGEKNPFFGKHHTEETKQKISEAESGEKNHNFGKHHRETTKQKMRENHQDQSGENNPFFGKHHTQEERAHHSKIMKGKNAGKNNGRARVVLLISPEGIEYKLSCYHPFCKEHNLSGGMICLVLQGKYNHHKGWTGKYIENKKA
jgi:group I intron endonuclease